MLYISNSMRVITQAMRFPEKRLQATFPNLIISKKPEFRLHLGILYYFREAKLRYFFHDASWVGISKEAIRYLVLDLRYRTIPTLIFLFFARIYTYEEDVKSLVFEGADEGLEIWISRQAIIGGVIPQFLDDSIDYDFERGIRLVKHRIWATSKTPKFSDLGKSLTNVKKINSQNGLLEQHQLEMLHTYTVTTAEINHGKLVTSFNKVLPLTRSQLSLGRSWPCDDVVKQSNQLYLLESSKLKSIEEAIFVGTSQNWFHFIIEYLPRYLSIPEHLRSTQTIIPKQTHKQIIELLGIIGFDKLIETDIFETVHVGKLTTILDYRFSHSFDFPAMRNELLKLQTFFSQIVTPNNAQKSSDRILIMRPSTTFRKMKNSAQLISILSNFGFEAINPEKLSFIQQVQYFRNAKIIVGQGGAALTSLLFCQPGTLIVELLPWSVRNYPFWETFANCLEIRHKTVISKKPTMLRSYSRNPELHFDFGEIVDLLEK